MWLWLGVFAFILLVIGFVYRYLDQLAESKFHPHAPKQALRQIQGRYNRG